MSKFETLARAAVVCQQCYGTTHQVSSREDSVIVLRGKVGFRVTVAADGELVVAPHRSPLGVFVTGLSDTEIAGVYAAIRDVVVRRLGALRCPHCRTVLHDDPTRCVLCRRDVAIAGLIARATEAVPADVFDRRCPWCGELADGTLRCRCQAFALADPAIPPGDPSAFEARDGGVVLDRRYRWYRRTIVK